MSISTTSGCSRCAPWTACSPLAASPTTVDVVLDLEHHPEAGAHQRLVVGDQDADAHGAERERRAHDEAALRPMAGVQVAAVERDALAHPDQAVAAVARRAVARRPGAPSSAISQLELAAAVADGDAACAPGPACLSALVSASWTMR